MAPRREVNRKLPPQLSELIIKLIEHADSFIRVFNNKEPRMREIERKFEKISAEVKEELETADAVKTGGLITGGVGVAVGVLGLLAAPFTGGASLAVTAAASGGIVGVAGVTITVGAIIIEFIIKNGSAVKLQRLGEEFMEIVQPMNKHLAEIKAISETLKKKFIKIQNADMKEIQALLSQVRSISVRATAELQKVVEFLSELVRLIMKIFKTTLSSEEEKKLPDFITKSGAECRSIIRDFSGKKKELQTFKENIQVYIS